jgi:hypothetical protein
MAPRKSERAAQELRVAYQCNIEGQPHKTVYEIWKECGGGAQTVIPDLHLGMCSSFSHIYS